MFSLKAPTIKQFVVNFCKMIYEQSGVSHCWSVNNSVKVLDLLRFFDSIDVYDFLSCIPLYHINLSKTNHNSYVTQLFMLYVYCIAILISCFISSKNVHMSINIFCMQRAK